MKVEHKFTPEQKLKWWGEGEWTTEPDLIEFDHLGLDCKIIRVAYEETLSKDEHFFGGYLCGYVKLPKEYSIPDNYENLSFDIHGGITFSEYDANKNFWIGFDCGHLDDIIPSEKNGEIKNFIDKFDEYLKKSFPSAPLFNPTYKNTEFVIWQCVSLAEQIKK